MTNVTPATGNPKGYDLTAYAGQLSGMHQLMLASAAISPECANAREYRGVTDRAQLRRSGHRAAWVEPPGLLIPGHNVRGVIVGNQYRPDEPLTNPDGKTLKYLTPPGMRMYLDVNPLVRMDLGDPAKPLYLTEGIKKGDSIVSAGGVGVAVLGVWNWRGTNDKGGKTLLSDFEEIAFDGRVVYLVFDSDVVTKPEVATALVRLHAVLVRRAAIVKVVKLPQAEDGSKVGADDYLAAGHTLADLDDLVVDLADLSRSLEPVTEVVVAQALVAEYGDQFRYCPERGRWLSWGGSRWQWDVPETIREYAKKTAREVPRDGEKESVRFYQRVNSAVGISGLTRLAQTDPAVVVRIAALDAEPYVLNTPGGVLDLRTAEVRPHSTVDLFTKITGCAVSTEDCPKFRAFLAETFGNDAELIDYVQRLLGYSCIGTVLDHVLPFCHGAGANGKSVLMNLVMMVLGRDEDGYAIAAQGDFMMAKMGTAHPTEIARLRGARFVSCQEVNADQRFDEAKIKQLTGGDTLAGRFMHRDFFSFSPTHHLWLAGNHKPEVRDGGPAFWRRVRLIPFNHVVPNSKQNPHLAEELYTVEGPAILGWLVSGAAAMLRDGLREPDAVIAATTQYQSDEDSVSCFLAEECKLGEAFNANVGHLRTAYQSWCQRNGLDPVGSKTFSQSLQASGLVPNHGRTGTTFSGVRLLSEGEKSPPPPPPPRPGPGA